MSNPPLPDPTAPERADLSPGLRFLLDLGPLLVFFAVNALAPGDDIDQAVWATGAFMIAIAITMAYSFWKTRRVTPMQIVTAVIVGVCWTVHRQAVVETGAGVGFPGHVATRLGPDDA